MRSIPLKILFVILFMLTVSWPATCFEVAIAGEITSGDEVSATIDAFQQYQNSIEQQYRGERDEILQEYEKYERLAAAEYLAYEKELLQYWPEAVMSTPKSWVEYSSDYQTRKIVDFDKKEISVEIIIGAVKQEDLDKLFQEHLADLIQESQQTAFNRNQPARNIERKLKEASPGARTARLGETPILLEVMTGKKKPTSQEINRAVSRLQRQATITRTSSQTGQQQRVRLTTALPSNAIQHKAGQYRSQVNEFSKHRGIPDSLVLAVIHTESAFNPMARSHVPAYGLMQIVPQSAGRDVSRLLFGQSQLLSPSYLYNGTNNIRVGTSYLYILFYKYLKEIEDPTSRQYCTIAAYNTGAGNVARTFTGTTNVHRAAAIINQMAPADVFRYLRNNLPHQETRDYLRRVQQRMEMYENM